MTPRLAALACVVWLSACTSEPEGGPLWGDRPVDGLDLRAALSTDAIELFGTVELTIDWFLGEGVEAAFSPEIPEAFVGEVGTPNTTTWTDPKGRWSRYVLALQPTELGELTIPPFEVSSGEITATTAALSLTVTSVLEGAGEALEEPAPLFEPRTPTWVWWSLGAGVVGIAVLAFWLRRRGTRPRTDPETVALPPHVTALRALARLRSAPRQTEAEVESFYVAVSQVLRTYLEGRFGLRAPERTTEEFLPEVEQSGVLDAHQRAHLRQFLEQCDLVKFAAARPDPAVHESTFAFAETFVESTRPDRVSVREEVPA